MNRFIQALFEVCKKHLLAEKWLIAPSLRVGHQWLDAVARAGQPGVNVHVKTLKSLALDLAAPDMAAQRVTLASRRGSALLLDRVLRSSADGQLKYLAGVRFSSGVAETVLDTVEAVRLAGLDATGLAAGSFEVSAKAHDLKWIAREYLRLLAEEKLVDQAEVLKLAIARLAAKPSGLGSDLLVLLPGDIRHEALERQLIDRIPTANQIVVPVDEPANKKTPTAPIQNNLERFRWLLTPASAPAPLTDDTVQIVRAIGEVNEVRHALRTCVALGIPWDDVELLHTDTDKYVTLVYETLATLDRSEAEPGDELPVTFAEGIPCRYARPGRALAAWLGWIRDGFPQVLLERMLKEGLLEIAGAGEEISGYARLAGLVRGLGIAAGRERYLPVLDREIAALQEDLETADDDTDDDDSSANRQLHWTRDLRDYEALRELLTRLLNYSPDPTAPQQEIITAAVRFVTETARSVNKLDRFAAQKLGEELRDMEHWLSREDGTVGIDVWEWLENLPATVRVLGSGPRPGCLHVDGLGTGGYSGRRHTFILGLDDGRFPGAGLQDPLLLDSERLKLSSGLATAADRLQARMEDFARLLARLRGQVTLSYPCHSVEDDRELFASPALLLAFRTLAGKPDGDQQDLLRWLPPPVSFAPRNAEACLDLSEWWLWRLCSEEGVRDAVGLVERQFPHLAAGKQAIERRQSAKFTAYDGCVPQAGMDLDPTGKNGKVLSASGLQLLGRCPLAFFFHYGLDIEPPDNTAVDPECWLDAPTAGSLLHELFEQFIRELVAKGRLPEFTRDRGRLEKLLAKQAEVYKEQVPPPSESVYQQQLKELQTTALTFLREEERFCAATGSRPIYLEASLGMEPGEHGTPLDDPEPIPLALPGRKTIRVRGRVDRIDQIGKGALHTYSIWDYKTGSTYGYNVADPFQQGRRVQAYIYVSIVAHQLQKTVSPEAEVSYFGFVFPGKKAMGQRFQWSPADLADGKQILAQLVETIRQGAFLATNDVGEDCKFCDYQRICGNLPDVANASQSKLENLSNETLAGYRALRLPVVD